MRGNSKISENINESWLLEKYRDKPSGFFANYYNDLPETLFTITDKIYLDKYDKDNRYINKVFRKYGWDWKKDYDNGTNYDFPAELMNFSLNSEGDVIADLTDTYLDREDLDIPTIKYSHFFIKNSELKFTIPNQGDDGLSLAYINDDGELIIDNDQY